MIFFFGEKLRSRSTPSGDHHCSVCRSTQRFATLSETLWFTLFGIPLLPVEQTAQYQRCENCLSAFQSGEPDVPTAVSLMKKVIVYILLGYGQDHHGETAREICVRISGFDFTDNDFHETKSCLASGQVEMVEQVRLQAATMNAVGKQQVVEAAFLATYLCCDLEYEDRLRINLIGNALGVGLEFVDYAIEQTRRQGYYGMRRLASSGARV